MVNAKIASKTQASSSKEVKMVKAAVENHLFLRRLLKSKMDHGYS